MDVKTQPPSLLPFLSGEEGRVYLVFSPVPETVDISGKRAGSFLPDYSCDSLSIGFRAQIRSDYGSLVGSVLLCVQRDSYPALTNQSLPLTNTIIDQCWQRAGISSPDALPQFRPIIFNDQISAENRLLPFASMFFCNRKKLYFHPPCPHCGALLQLCRDDQLLEECNLSYYSKSLRRYMYCPDCTPLHGRPWYVYTRESGDDASVRDCDQLIGDFGAIQGNVLPELHFPCIQCSHRTDCYGESAEASVTIKIFAFYPFYMLATRDFSLSGHDYIALISGSSVDELLRYKRKRGFAGNSTSRDWFDRYDQSKCFFHPPDDPRHFLEVLYLKILFFQTAAQDVICSGSAGDLKSGYLSPRSLAVCVDSESRFPWFWNYALQCPGLENYLTEQINISPFEGKTKRFYLGLQWFVILFINEAQGELEIVDKIKLLVGENGDQPLSAKIFKPLFPPDQILWSARRQEQTVRSLAEWENILNIGVQLLNAGYDNNSLMEFKYPEGIEAVLSDLKHQLFSMRPSESRLGAGDEDREISAILTGIADKWARGTDNFDDHGAFMVSGGDPFLPPEKDGKEYFDPGYDPDETVIISKDFKHQPASNSAGISSGDDGGGITSSTETGSIFNSGTDARLVSEENKARDRVTEHSLDETVVIPATMSHPSPLEPEVSKTSDPEGDNQDQLSSVDDELAETIQIKPDSPENMRTRQSKPEDQQDKYSDLEETTIIKKGTTTNTEQLSKESEAGSVSQEDEDDFLTETVVLRPSDKKKP